MNVPNTRWRDNDTGAVVDALRNPGTWPPVLAWLDATGYTVPFLGEPAVIRNPVDGTLTVTSPEGRQTAQTGDFVVRHPDGRYTACPAAEFRTRYTAEPWTDEQMRQFEAELDKVMPPELPVISPGEWTDEQVAEFKKEWDEFTSSDFARRHPVKLLPPGTCLGPVTHIAGHQVQVGSRLRQRCSWCGAILIDYDLSNLAAPEGQDPNPGMWETGRLVRVDGILSQLLDHGDGAELPEDACARTSGDG